VALITELDGKIHALLGRESLVALYIGLLGFFVTPIDPNLLLHDYNYSPPLGDTSTYGRSMGGEL